MNESTNWQALCAELLAQAIELIDTSPRDDATIIRHQELFDRARDALAQPEAESSITFNESHDSEVMRVDQRGFHYRGELIKDAGLAHRLMVTFLQRHTSMHPEVVEREDAQPEPEGPTDEELLAAAAAAIDTYQNSGIAIGEYEAETECALEVYGSELIAFARAVLARWARPAIEPTPEP
jgi:hypothetical protein